MGRKAFGPTKKRSCDTKHCQKAKKASESKSRTGEGVRHPRAFESQAVI